MQRTVGNPQISGNLGLGLLARLDELHRFHLKFSRKASLCLWHDLSLPVSGPLFQVYLPHFSGSRPPLPCSISCKMRFCKRVVFPEPVLPITYSPRRRASCSRITSSSVF